MASLLKPFGNLLSPKRTVPTGALRIDWTHPLANGLLACYVPGVMGGINVASQGGDLSFASAGTLTGNGAEGPALVSNAANTGMTAIAPAGFKGLTAYSLYWRGDSLGTPGPTSRYIGLTASNADVDPYLIYDIGLTGGTNFQVAYAQNGGYAASTSSLSPPSSGTFSYASTILQNGRVKTYLNGAIDINTAISGSMYGGTSTSLVELNCYGPDTTRIIQASCFIGCIWGRQLSDDEIAWLDLEPYCFLLPAEQEMPALFVSASGPTTPADCSMLFQSSANLVHPRSTLDTNQPRDNMFMGWGKPTPSPLAFWFQPPFLGPTPRSTQNTNQAFFISPNEPKTPTAPWFKPPLDVQRHVPTIYTAQSFVCNPTIGPPVPVDAFWTQPPDLLHHPATLDTRQQFEFNPPTPGVTPADCSFLFEPSALLTHPQTLDTNQPLDDAFAGWTQNQTPVALGFWKQPEDLFKHPATIDTNQPRVSYQDKATPSSLGFWTQPLDLLRHPSTVDTNQPFNAGFSGQANVTPTAFGFWTQPPDLLKHPATVDTNQPPDDAFSGWTDGKLTPTPLGFWTQPQDLLRHPNTVDTRQQFDFKPPPAAVTPADCSFLFQPNALLRHPSTLDTNQPLDDAFVGWTDGKLTPTQLGFWIQAPDLVRHPAYLETNQPVLMAQVGVTPVSLAFWWQPSELLRHPVPFILGMQPFAELPTVNPQRPWSRGYIIG